MGKIFTSTIKRDNGDADFINTDDLQYLIILDTELQVIDNNAIAYTVKNKIEYDEKEDKMYFISTCKDETLKIEIDGQELVDKASENAYDEKKKFYEMDFIENLKNINRCNFIKKYEKEDKIFRDVLYKTKGIICTETDKLIGLCLNLRISKSNRIQVSEYISLSKIAEEENTNIYMIKEDGGKYKFKATKVAGKNEFEYFYMSNEEIEDENIKNILENLKYVDEYDSMQQFKEHTYDTIADYEESLSRNSLGVLDDLF